METNILNILIVCYHALGLVFSCSCSILSGSYDNIVRVWSLDGMTDFGIKIC